jgi:ABC-type sugar transport system ATPase subunit
MGSGDSLQDRRARNELVDSQKQIARALERIAAAMEAQAELKVVDEMTPAAVLSHTENYVLGQYVERLNKAGFKVIRA